MIPLDKLTVKSQEALQEAVRLASERGHAQVEPEHLLVALLRQEGGVAGELFARTGVSPQRILADAERELAALPKVSGAVSRGLAPGMEPLFRRALSEADAFRDEYLSAEHFLLALCGEPGKAADLVLLSDDPTRVPPEDIRNIRVEMTILGGEIAWDATR